MPRKRRSTGNKVDINSNLQQVQFTAPKRRIKERGPTWSTPSKFQQTITQMNPSIYVPAPEYEGLTTDDDQEQESYVTSPGRRKRRKITPAKTSSRKTSSRSAQRQTLTQMVPFRALYHPELEEENLDVMEDEQKENNVPSPMKRRKRKVSPENVPSAKIRKRRQKQETSKTEHQPGHWTEFDERQQENQSIPSEQKDSRELLHPPVTPRSRRKEIPSSQSPADTPLSTRSRRPSKSYSRSPLKERSTNIAPVTAPRRGGVRWGRKVEIADSLESREEESPVLMRASTSMAASRAENASGFGGKFSQLPTHSTVISDDWQWEETQIKGSYRDTLQREIVDSNEENDDDDLGAILIRRATTHTKDTSPTRECAPDHQTDRSRAASFSSSPQSQQQSNLQNHHPISISSLPKHTSPQPTPSPPFLPTLPRTDSAQASAQLFTSLHRITEPALETESQYEAGWHSYHRPSSLPSSPLQPPIESPSSSSPPTTMPTEPLPPHTRHLINSTQHNIPIPIPPSQATTTDTTQPSPRKLPPSSQPQFLPSPYKKLPTISSKTSPTAAAGAAAFPYSSSQPPMPPPPPSSSIGVGESMVRAWQWNGVRLTDSQLLPESLLRDDSLIGEDWGSADEEEGEGKEEEG